MQKRPASEGHSGMEKVTLAVDEISDEHRHYLQGRHGTADLNPLPSQDPADPLNWPTWKKVTNLLLIAFQSTSATFIAAGIIPAYEPLAEEYQTSLQRVSYLTSLQIFCLGFGPWFWTPISDRYGRRPIFLMSVFVSCFCSVGSAECTTYGSQAAVRAIQSFFLSPALGVGSKVVTETFFAKERGKYMGLWTALTTLGVPSGPFFMGFVAYHVGYEWIFWVFAIMNAVQFILQLFFGPETLYMRGNFERKTFGASSSSSASNSITPASSQLRAQYLRIGRIDHRPFKIVDFVRPGIIGVSNLNILVPAVSYAVVFCFCSVFLTVFIPQLFVPDFMFNPQQIGLQFLGLIIGTILGEQFSGPLSDRWMQLKTKRFDRSGERGPAPEWRLWISYLGFATVIAGLVVFCVQLEKIQGTYNVTPIVGAGISAFGNQIVTTVLITYAIDSHSKSEAASIGSFINAVRQTLGFVGPFWYTPCVDAIGLRATAGLFSGLVLVTSVLPVALLQLRRASLRASSEDEVS